MPRLPTSPTWRYGLAAFCVVGAATARYSLTAISGGQYLFLTFFPAVIVAAWAGGLGPSLLALGLSGVAAVAMMPAAGPRSFATLETRVGTAVFLLVGLSIAFMGGAMRAAWRRAEASEHESRRLLEVEHERVERFETTLKSIGDAVLTTDALGRIVGMNPAAEVLTGWPAAEAAGRAVVEVFRVVDEASRPRESPVERALREDAPAGLAPGSSLMARDGTLHPVEDSVAPIRDALGASRGVVLVFRDVSARRADEATIAEQIRLAKYGREVSRAVTQSATIDEMLEHCAQATVEHLGGAFARVWTLDESGETLILRASAGLYTHLDGAHGRIPVGMYKIGRIARDRQPHLTNAVVGDPSVPAQDWAKAEGMSAFAGYPLVVDGRMVGVLASFARHALNAASLRMMASVADEIALGIERHRGQEELHRQREWLRVTLASIGDGVVAADGRGLVTFLNPVAEALTGWSPAEAAGRPLAEVVRVVDEATGALIDARDLAGPSEGRPERMALVARGGSETPIEGSTDPIRGDRGEDVGVVTVLRDASARRRHEAELREGEERFRQMADSISHLAWMANADGHIFYYNSRWYEYTGKTPEQMAGWGWQSVHDPEALPAVLERWQSSIASGEPFDMVYPLRGSDGVLRPFLTRVTSLKDDQGHVRRWFGTNTDISERLQMEAALLAAKDEAEQANKAKDQFLAVLSHELRTPLNPILLAATAMLEQPGEPEDIRPTLEMIKQYASLQARLIDDLLDVMQIVRGKMPMHWGVADVHDLIRHAVEICRSEFQAKQMGLGVDLAASSHHVDADSARLQQVFWNLIKNAVKFTPVGGTISIQTRNEPGPDGPTLVVEVADNGIGIDPAMIPLIFDPFQQAETSIIRKFGGLGLGLAISRGVVDAHGGKLSVLSDGPGRGSTFRVELKALPEAIAIPNGHVDGGPRSTAPPALSPRRILLVEDEPVTLRLMAKLLRKLGHLVQVAGTIAAAQEAADAGEFDLIISDIGLPDGSGLDLMRRFVARRGPIPSIALTGYGMEEDIQRSHDAGFRAHLTKPIDFKKLEALIRQVVV